MYNGKANTDLESTENTYTDRFGYKIIFFLWFLYLFEPTRLLAYYFPVLQPMQWLPTALLLVAIFHWLRSPLKKYNYKWFTVFLIVNLFGTVIAFWDGNWGIARKINRLIFQFYILGIMTFTFLNDDEKIRKLFYLYFLHILYFAAWGIFSLKFFPMESTIVSEPTMVVPWHHLFDNRDGFGPLMVIGLAYCFYYYQAIENRRLKWLSMISGILCLAGAVLSYGRGVFLSMGLTIVFMWVQSKRKLMGMFSLVAAVGAIFVIISIIAPGNMYWNKMETIKEGTSDGTGLDRKILWGFAWKEFVNNPIFGVGTGNFGIAAVKLIPPEEALRLGYTQGRLWGRSLHCVPLTILSEYGLVGFTVFIFLVIDFIRTNKLNRIMSSRFLNNAKQIDGQRIFFQTARSFRAFSLGLMACFVAFGVNGFFYEIIYSPLFWNLIVMNKLIRINLSSVNS